jgi:serine/threonine protein phosphatase PrpC
MKVISLTAKGFRPYQEDRMKTFQYKQFIVSCIFDGHGGDTVSDFCVKHIERYFIINIDTHGTHDIPMLLRKLYAYLDMEVKKLYAVHTGTTATITIITPDRIYFSNAGDSMAMIAIIDKGDNNKEIIKNMSYEHKVENEISRIADLGGKIEYNTGMARIGGLNLSRSIGDYNLKRFVISAPFISSIPRANVKYIYQSSDGIWDVLDINEIASIIKQSSKKEKVLFENIIKVALEKGSTDNITSTYIEF